jgi:AcrR family transcriptional regulator
MSSDSEEARRQREARAAQRRERAAARRARGRERSRARRVLSTEAIVETALRIADEEGADAVSMRRVASELGVGTMSLYHHVGDKDELLELMSDAISGELLVPGEILGDWRAALRAIAHRTRESLLRHPWLIETRASRPLVTPNALRHIEQSVAVVIGLDVDRKTAVAMVTATDDYTIGHVFRQARFSGDRFSSAEDTARMRDLLATGDYPLLARLYADDPHLTPAPETFEIGLEWLFDGMQAVLDARNE